MSRRNYTPKPAPTVPHVTVSQVTESPDTRVSAAARFDGDPAVVQSSSITVPIDAAPSEQFLDSGVTYKKLIYKQPPLDDAPVEGQMGNAMIVFPPNYVIQESPVFRCEWVVPGPGKFVLPLRAPSTCDDVESAREYVLTVNELDDLTKHWVQTTAPELVLATSSITLSHADALAENERLVAENAQYAEVKAALTAHGISPTVEGVVAWKDRYEHNTELIRQGLADDAEAREKRVAAELDGLAETITRVRNRIFPPEVEPVTPPIDFNGVTVIVPVDCDPRIRDSVPNAIVVDQQPGGLSADDIEGIRALLRAGRESARSGEFGGSANCRRVFNAVAYIEERLGAGLL